MTAAPATEILNAHEPRPTSGGAHLRYLDGIRGLAALYVLFTHLPQARLIEATHYVRILNMLDFALLGFGHYAVDVFIVLSGYCLMLPVVSTADKHLRGGLASYFRRRALRIIPPYLGALIVSLALIAITQGAVAPTRGAVISHLLLVHNAREEWCFAINPPMWSVAVEWQIYFVFALLLLPLWRRLGAAVTVAAAFAIGFLPLIVLPKGYNLIWASPWYVGLFALGMAGASVSIIDDKPHKSAGRWVTCAFLFGAVAAGMFCVQRAGWAHVRWIRWMRQEYWGAVWMIDLPAGFCVACALTAMTRIARSGETCLPLRFFESWPLAQLGKFSYSLYLIHFPLIGALAMLVGVKLPPMAGLCVVFFGGLLLSLAAAYLLYLAIERHCMPSRRPVSQP